MSARHWMQNTTAIHNSPLKKICLPSTHDSGTYAFIDRLGEGGFGKQVFDLIERAAALLDAVPFINKVINPTQWVMSTVNDSLRGLCRATHNSVARQLDDGIRCLDLRIAYNKDDNQFYTFHGLMGVPLRPVLNDIAAFLGSTTGEIVYITFGHFGEFNKRQDLYDLFFNQVRDALGLWAYNRQLSGAFIANNPFDQTYREIIGQGGVDKSRVILVVAPTEVAAPSEFIFWHKSFSPPDNQGDGSIIAGHYTDTDQFEKMLADQKTRQRTAGDKPFALYLTLTPDLGDYAEVITANLASAIAKLGLAVFFIPLIGPGLSLALEAVALAFFAGELLMSWRTLEQLSANVNDHLPVVVHEHFAAAGRPHNISFLYVDFYEKTEAVALAIALSTANAREAMPRVPVTKVIASRTSSSNNVDRYAFFGQERTAGDGWRMGDEMFRAYREHEGATVPVYSHCETNDNGYNFMLSMSPMPPGGWLGNGVAFYAFAQQSPGMFKIWQYGKPDQQFGTIYYYSASAQEQNWGSPSLLCYALPATMVPIYEQSAEQPYGEERYVYSQSGSAAGSGWTDVGVAWLASLRQQGDGVPIYRHVRKFYNYRSYLLSRNDTAPAGHEYDALAFYAYPQNGPGLMPIRQFTKLNPTFETVYRYSPLPSLPGWIGGEVLFYAGLNQRSLHRVKRDVAGTGAEVIATDLAALMAPGMM